MATRHRTPREAGGGRRLVRDPVRVDRDPAPVGRRRVLDHRRTANRRSPTSIRPASIASAARPRPRSAPVEASVAAGVESAASRPWPPSEATDEPPPSPSPGHRVRRVRRVGRVRGIRGRRSGSTGSAGSTGSTGIGGVDDGRRPVGLAVADDRDGVAADRDGQGQVRQQLCSPEQPAVAIRRRGTAPGSRLRRPSRRRSTGCRRSPRSRCRRPSPADRAPMIACVPPRIPSSPLVAVRRCRPAPVPATRPRWRRRRLRCRR